MEKSVIDSIRNFADNGDFLSIRKIFLDNDFSFFELTEILEEFKESGYGFEILEYISYYQPIQENMEDLIKSLRMGALRKNFRYLPSRRNILGYLEENFTIKGDKIIAWVIKDEKEDINYSFTDRTTTVVLNGVSDLRSFFRSSKKINLEYCLPHTVEVDIDSIISYDCLLDEATYLGDINYIENEGIWRKL